MRRFRYLLTVLILAMSLLASSCEFSPAARGEVLNLAGNEPITLDPAVSGDAGSHYFITQIFSGLMRLDENLSPVPDIAESYTVSDDGKTYAFTLRQNVKFQNGIKVTARDIKYSWERACNPVTRSNTAVTYLGDIVGAREVLQGKAEDISGVRVLGDYTLEVTIDAPKSYFLSKLTYPTAYVVDRANVGEGREWWREPNGTGPFKLSEWQERQTIILERNSLYYGRVAGVDSVAFQLYSGVPIDLYETDRVDAAAVSSAYIDKAMDKSGPFYSELRMEPELSFYYIGFNASKPPFNDASIRRAFSMAVDRAKLTLLVFRSTVSPASGILPPGIPGYNENLTGLPFDPARAKELIRSSSYGDVSRLPPITITTAGYGGLIASDLEAIIAEIEKNLGVEVRVRQLEPERFLYSLEGELDEMYDMGWIADYPHPQNFLDILFHGEADYNYGGYSNPEVDRLLQMAAVEKDTAKSLATYQQVEKILVDDAACIPLWFGQNYYLVKPYVKGYSLNPLGLANLNTVILEYR